MSMGTPIDAAQVAIGHCDECDSIHIHLIDAQGTCYTRARIGVSQVDEVIEQLLAQAELLKHRLQLAPPRGGN
jgi:hypothetical protein